MNMKTPSAAHGGTISGAEVTSVSAQGFSLQLDGEALFLPYSEFPWFKDAPIAKLAHVIQPHPGHLYWPELDVDLSVASIRDPAAYPLRAGHRR